MTCKWKQNFLALVQLIGICMSKYPNHEILCLMKAKLLPLVDHSFLLLVHVIPISSLTFLVNHLLHYSQKVLRSCITYKDSSVKKKHKTNFNSLLFVPFLRWCEFFPPLVWYGQVMLIGVWGPQGVREHYQSNIQQMLREIKLDNGEKKKFQIQGEPWFFAFHVSN